MVQEQKTAKVSKKKKLTQEGTSVNNVYIIALI